jgi:hypothetical protein
VPPDPPDLFEALWFDQHEIRQAYINHYTTVMANSDAAQDRARLLFESFLSDRQLHVYRRLGFVDLYGNRGSKFRLYTERGLTGNVHLFRGPASHCSTASLCAHPVSPRGPYELPTFDYLLGQFLLLQTDEDAFLSIANLQGTWMEWHGLAWTLGSLPRPMRASKW